LRIAIVGAGPAGIAAARTHKRADNIGDIERANRSQTQDSKLSLTTVKFLGFLIAVSGKLKVKKMDIQSML
jgi:flavin-dependent dehydrogenase